MTTTTQTSSTRTGICRHDLMAVCWLCSDRVPWWRAARIKARYGERPPNLDHRIRRLRLRSEAEE